MSNLFLKDVPIENHPIRGRDVSVYRADLVPQTPLASYLKMIELYPFIQNLAKTYKCMGYYAVPQSEWVGSIIPLAESVGVHPIIGISNTKVMPEYVRTIDDKYLYKLSPNIYNVNFARTKKYVESQGGFMVPMGLECKEVVDGLTDFLKTHPIPKADNVIVPTGSGVALCGIVNHLGTSSKIWSICTRPAKSVEKVVDKYVPGFGDKKQSFGLFASKK